MFLENAGCDKRKMWNARMLFISGLLFIFVLFWYGKILDSMRVGGIIEAEPLIRQGRMYQTYTKYEKYGVSPEIEYDDTLYEGETQVCCQERKGVRAVTVLATFCNGHLEKEQTVEQMVLTQPIATKIKIGTRKREEFIVPLETYFYSSPFGERWGRMHKGIDLAVDCGTPVFAAASGEILVAEYVNGYGNCVDILHENRKMTRYGHLDAILVSVGDKVEQGQVIAKSGNTGNSTGPHLHFEIRVDGEAVDPLDYITLN